MSRNSIILDGQVATRGKQAVSGTRVEIQRARRDVVGATVTRSDGRFSVRIHEDEFPELFRELNGERVSMRVVDGRGRVIAKRDNVLLSTAETPPVTLSVAAKTAKTATPTIEPMPRLRGGMIDHDALQIVDMAIAALVPKGQPGHNRYIRASRCPLPDIDVFGNLLEDAWGVLDARPGAELRFRETLNFMGERLPAARGGPSPEIGLKLLQDTGLDTDIRKHASPPISTMPSAMAYPGAHFKSEPRSVLFHPCPMPPPRFAPVYAAAMLSARTVGDAAYMIGAVEHGLCTLNKVNGMVDAATEGLATGRLTRLRGMLDHFAGECGPDDGPIPPFPEPHPKPDCPEPPFPPGLPRNSCELERLECIRELAENLWRLRRRYDPYVIDSITPNNACPLATIVIRGSNFGDHGQVCFPSGTGGDVCVAATSWTDTEIHVVVPQEAGAGTLYLKIVEDIIPTCNSTLVIHRPGEGDRLWLGGSAHVASLWVDGAIDPSPVAPGSTVQISWVASHGGAGSSVRIRVTRGGAVFLNQSGLPDVGSLNFTVPAAASDQVLTVTATASNSCGNHSLSRTFTVHRAAQVFITDMEITQATQFLRADEHLSGATPASARGADNSVPLLAEKATLVRVYVATDQIDGFNAGQVPGVRVRLRGFRDGAMLGERTPLTDPITATNDTSVAGQRGNLAASANFRLPASWTGAGGPLKLEARISLNVPDLDSVDESRDRFTLDGIQIITARSLDCVLLRINYQGAGGGNGTPGEAASINTLHFVRRAFPTHRLRVFLPEPGDQVLRFDGNLGSNSGGGCGGWSSMLDEVEDLAKDYDDDDDKVWCAVVRNGVPTNVASGCGSGSRSHALGYAAFRVGDNPTAAQEVAHAFDRDHTFDDGGWPNYNYGDSDSIGEYGVEVEPLNLFDPNNAADYMSYDGAPLWTSPYTYRGLMSRFFARSAGSAIVVSSSGTKPAEGRVEQLMVTGDFYPESGRFKMRPLYHIPAYLRPPSGKMTRFQLALVNDNGETLVARPIHSGEQRKWQIHISQGVPMEEDAVALEIRDGDKVLKRIDRPAGRPKIAEVKLHRGERRWRLEWTAGHSEGRRLLYGVAVTYDSGKSWRKRAIMIRRPVLSIDSNSLAGGKDCCLRVFATDGFNTVYRDSERFSLPIKPPLIIPLNLPLDGKVDADKPMLLEVEAISPRFGSLADNQIKWVSDRDGEIGTGRQVWTQLAEGRHRLEIVAQEDEVVSHHLANLQVSRRRR